MRRSISPTMFFALLAVALFQPGANAQRGGGRGFGFGGAGFGRAGFGRMGPVARRGMSYWGDPFFYDDYPVQSLAFESAPPAMQRLLVADTPQQTKSEPLMIEWQGDRYVRIGGGTGATRTANILQDYAETAATKSPLSITNSEASAKNRQMLAAVLVYRDGHREEAPDYAIVGGTLYARGDYWKNGYWTKNIELSALDIPATMKANQQAGVKFVLPSGPNEVVTRP